MWSASVGMILCAFLICDDARTIQNTVLWPCACHYPVLIYNFTLAWILTSPICANILYQHTSAWPAHSLSSSKQLFSDTSCRVASPFIPASVSLHTLLCNASSPFCKLPMQWYAVLAACIRALQPAIPLSAPGQTLPYAVLDSYLCFRSSICPFTRPSVLLMIGSAMLQAVRNRAKCELASTDLHSQPITPCETSQSDGPVWCLQDAKLASPLSGLCILERPFEELAMLSKRSSPSVLVRNCLYCRLLLHKARNKHSASRMWSQLRWLCIIVSSAPCRRPAYARP